MRPDRSRLARPRDRHLRVAALLAAIVLGCAKPALATTLSGGAAVVDGDTIEIGGTRIRLFGIDAPEAAQSCYPGDEPWACGKASADALRSLMGDDPVTCSGEDTDPYGRLVAVCTAAGADLNQAMVAQGWATAFRRYSDKYVADEYRARGGRLGLWSSHFVSPEEYRAAQRQAPPSGRDGARAGATAAPYAAGCLIKGNHSRRGDWIYHLPGEPYYAETRAEQMFCSEAEAQAAGYRRSRAR